MGELENQPLCPVREGGGGWYFKSWLGLPGAAQQLVPGSRAGFCCHLLASVVRKLHTSEPSPRQRRELNSGVGWGLGKFFLLCMKIQILWRAILWRVTEPSCARERLIATLLCHPGKSLSSSFLGPVFEYLYIHMPVSWSSNGRRDISSNLITQIVNITPNSSWLPEISGRCFNPFPPVQNRKLWHFFIASLFTYLSTHSLNAAMQMKWGRCLTVSCKCTWAFNKDQLLPLLNVITAYFLSHDNDFNNNNNNNNNPKLWHWRTKLPRALILLKWAPITYQNSPFVVFRESPDRKEDWQWQMRKSDT